jgi:hypothetical protein
MIFGKLAGYPIKYYFFASKIRYGEEGRIC